jgi:hypothetical protein
MENQENYILLKKILNEVDPIGLIDEDTPESLDEYDSEIKEILKVDISLMNNQELGELIHKVFVEYFNEELAGSKETYNAIADKFIEANQS